MRLALRLGLIYDSIETFSVQHPIMLAGMNVAAGPKLAAAVTVYIPPTPKSLCADSIAECWRARRHWWPWLHPKGSPSTGRHIL
jgi:hypothetical protein